MNKKNMQSSIIGTVSVLLLFVVFTLNITAVRADITIQILIYWAIFVLAGLLILLKRRIKKHLLYLCCFSVYVVLITIISQSMNFSEFSINFGYMTLWIWSLIIFTIVNDDFGFGNKTINLIALYLIVIGVYIICSYEARSVLEDWGFVNVNYYLLCGMPILALVKKGWMKKIALTVACITVVLSLKRTSILALLAIAISLILYNLRKSIYFKIKAIVAIIIFIVVAMNYDTIASWLGVDIFSRFGTLSETGGNGRTEIYKHVFENIRDGGAIRFLFGCGYNGMINYYGSALSSHNDFLEILVDYGLMGLVFYISIILRYIKICIYNIRKASQYAEACIVSICVFIFVSSFGHCVIYPSYFMFILFFWTYIEKKTNSIGG